MEPCRPEQVSRLAGRRGRQAYGCGSAPDFDRLPLVQDVRTVLTVLPRGRECHARWVSSRIYTRTGDDGSTGQFLGGRVSKADPLVDACGDVDEAVALLGVARSGCPDEDLADLLL